MNKSTLNNQTQLGTAMLYRAPLAATTLRPL